MIAECRNLSMLRKSLATLPQTLDQTYDRILTAIKEKDRVYTIRILQWLTFSSRPLTIEEVAEVVAIDVAREPAFDPDEVLLDPLEALEICSSLVTITKTWGSTRIVALAHYSVQEYLVSERIRKGPAKQYSMQEAECHKAMTIGCLGYLHRFQEPMTDETFYTSALADYSARFWNNHLQKTADGVEEMSRLAMTLLLMNKQVFANSIQIYDPDGEHSGGIATPLYYASLFGLTLITKLLLDQDVDVNAQTGEWGTALLAAVAGKHLAVVELLVKAKADVDFQNQYEEIALHRAIRLEETAIVKVLIDAGADVNKREMDDYAIHLASKKGDEVLVTMLVDAKADVSVRDQYGYDALTMALHGHHKAVVKLLVDTGANVNTRDHNDCSALRFASREGDEELVRMFIKAGADVNAPGSENFGNALLAAAEGGHTAVVKLLLDNGAEIDAQHAKWGSALHGAVRSSQEATAEVLLRRGASVASDMQSKGVMNHAVDNPDCTSSLVRMLQQYNVPLDTIDVANMTPLHYCVKFEHEAIARQLIDAGVPIDSRVRRRARPSKVGISGNSQAVAAIPISASISVGLTPLHLAALRGRPLMTKFLLAHGADPNALSEHSETPLHLALRATILGHKCEDDWDQVRFRNPHAHNETLDALLADPVTSLTAADINGESSLHCVAYGRPGSAKLIQRLISRGADPHLVNSNQQNPLHLAIQAQNIESVKTLLGRGVNVHPTSEKDINILHYAAQVRNHDILLALFESEQVEATALVTLKNENGQNVLHHLLSMESTTQATEVKTVQWLLELGVNASELDHFGISPLAQYFEGPRPTINVGICRSLLGTKEAASFASQEGQTLGHLCAKSTKLGGNILSVLNEGGVDMMKKDCRGRTVLHYAVLYNTLTENALEYLLNVVGIKANEQDDQGHTALQYTIEKVDAYEDRDSWDFQRWESIRYILSKLQETEVRSLLIQADSSGHLSNTSLPLNPNQNRMQ